MRMHKWLLLLPTQWIFKAYKTGDITSYEAMVSYAGSSSMEICVQIIIEDVLNKERHLAALSF